MNDHDDMTNADVMSAEEIAEYDRAAEYAQDAADDARYAELADAEAADSSPDDDCEAEFIDGSWTYCGCEECDERETRDGDEGWEL